MIRWIDRCRLLRVAGLGVGLSVLCYRIAVAQENSGEPPISNAPVVSAEVTTPSPNPSSASSDTEQQTADSPNGQKLTADSASTMLVLVVGADGQDEYAEQFSTWAESWRFLAQRNGWQLVSIGPQRDTTPSSERDSNQTESNSAVLTDLEQLKQALYRRQQLSLTTHAQDHEQRLWLVLIGHGTSHAGIAKFNLTGPDLNSEQLRQWLQPITGEIVVINCSSSSAPFLTQLSAPGRTIITATKSGSEHNFSRFGGFLSKAIHESSADLDHDGEVSLLEVFLKASKDTQQFYRENARLATEQAIMDDNHDKVGTPASFYVGILPAKIASDSKAIDGIRAARINLSTLGTSRPLTAQQRQDRDNLEEQLDHLRQQKSKHSEEEYFRLLEELLVPIAKLYTD